MAKKINVGWLKDKNREKFAPKTFISQVIDKNGKSLEEILQTKVGKKDLTNAVAEAIAVMKSNGDFITESDKAEIVTEVLDSLPTWEGGAY